jgi:hypothetical protein
MSCFMVGVFLVVGFFRSWNGGRRVVPSDNEELMHPGLGVLPTVTAPAERCSYRSMGSSPSFLLDMHLRL